MVAVIVAFGWRRLVMFAIGGLTADELFELVMLNCDWPCPTDSTIAIKVTTAMTTSPFMRPQCGC